MTHKSGLGRGLDALIPTGEPSHPSGVAPIPVAGIRRNPRQTRTSFDSQELAELAASIREYGVIQPLIVTRSEQDDEYILIAGERRWLAARQAGLDIVPAIVREASDLQRLELALIENVQRTDLSPLEAAEAYRQMVDDFGFSHEEIAAHVGKSRTAVTNTLRLLKLPPSVQQALTAGRISEGHARALLTLSTPQSQAAVLQTILKRELNVRQTEALVRKVSGERPMVRFKERTPEVSDLEARLRNSLGTKVNLNRKRKGGTIVIHFYSDEELDSIVEKILGE